MSEKCKLSKLVKADNLYRLDMTVTKGKLLVIKHALENYRDAGSSVADDLLGFLNMAANDSNVDWS